MPLFQAGNFADFRAFQTEAAIQNAALGAIPLARPMLGANNNGRAARKAARDAWDNLESAFNQLNAQNFAVDLTRLQALQNEVVALGVNPNNDSIDSFKHRILAYAIQVENTARANLSNIGGVGIFTQYWNAHNYDAVYTILQPEVAGFGVALVAANETGRRYRYLAEHVCLPIIDQQIRLAAQAQIDALRDLVGNVYVALSDDAKHVALTDAGLLPVATETDRQFQLLVAAQLVAVNAAIDAAADGVVTAAGVDPVALGAMADDDACHAALTAVIGGRVAAATATDAAVDAKLAAALGLMNHAIGAAAALVVAGVVLPGNDDGDYAALELARVAPVVTETGRRTNLAIDAAQNLIVVRIDAAAQTRLDNLGGMGVYAGLADDAKHVALTGAAIPAGETGVRFQALVQAELVAVNGRITVAAQAQIDALHDLGGNLYAGLDDNAKHAVLTARPALGLAPTATEKEFERLAFAELGRVNSARHIQTTVPLSADPSPNPIALKKQLEAAQRAFAADRTLGGDAAVDTAQKQADYEAALKVQGVRVNQNILVTYLAGNNQERGGVTGGTPEEIAEASKIRNMAAKKNPFKR